MEIPVAVITDSDIREYEKSGDEFSYMFLDIVQQENRKRIASINSLSENKVLI